MRQIWQIKHQLLPPEKEGSKKVYLIVIKVLNSGKHFPDNYIRKLYGNIQTAEYPEYGLEFVLQDGIVVAIFVDDNKLQQEESGQYVITALLDYIGLNKIDPPVDIQIIYGAEINE